MINKMPEIVDEVSEIIDIAESVYQEIVGDYFKEVQELYQRFKSIKDPITDSELEIILTLVPLKLFGVSEALSKTQLMNEIVKIKTKETKGADAELDYKLTSSLYGAVITRIEKEMSFCRELIMSCKKIWDSRRHAEDAPIHSDVTADLPEYQGPQTYIK